MEEIAGWIAPAATMIAAMMTAANLGARFTGWGFVVFLAGSIAWCVVAALTGQENLLLTNAFLTIVNIAGIWRWLGRAARYESGAEAATVKSEVEAAPDLFAVSLLDGQPVHGPDGAVIAHAVGAMATQGDGRIVYVVVREGGIGGVGEALHALEWGDLGIDGERIVARIDAGRLRALRRIKADDWPGAAPA